VQQDDFSDGPQHSHIQTLENQGKWLEPFFFVLTVKANALRDYFFQITQYDSYADARSLPPPGKQSLLSIVVFFVQVI
jgi:hypothetical protein